MKLIRFGNPGDERHKSGNKPFAFRLYLESQPMCRQQIHSGDQPQGPSPRVRESPDHESVPVVIN